MARMPNSPTPDLTLVVTSKDPMKGRRKGFSPVALEENDGFLEMLTMNPDIRCDHQPPAGQCLQQGKVESLVPRWRNYRCGAGKKTRKVSVIHSAQEVNPLGWILQLLDTVPGLPNQHKADGGMIPSDLGDGLHRQIQSPAPFKRTHLKEVGTLNSKSGPNRLDFLGRRR